LDLRKLDIKVVALLAIVLLVAVFAAGCGKKLKK
jgi:hypothetical protein